MEASRLLAAYGSAPRGNNNHALPIREESFGDYQEELLQSLTTPSVHLHNDELDSQTSAIQRSYQETIRAHAATAMRMDFDILSAEMHSDYQAPVSQTITTTRNSGPKATKMLAFGMVPQDEPEHSSHQAGKRMAVKAKANAANKDGSDEDASKKQRGRPRLDTRDETAADVSLL
jgi:hypothetical protein